MKIDSFIARLNEEYIGFYCFNLFPFTKLAYFQGWLKSVILGRGSSYKDLIIYRLKSRGGGRDFAEISILALYMAKLY